MESKDSISITEALGKQSTFSLKNFHSSNIEPWLLIEIGVAEAQHVDFFPFLLFFVLFSSKNFCSILLTVSVPIFYKLELSLIWLLNKYSCNAYYVSDTLLDARCRTALIFYVYSNYAVHNYSKTHILWMLNVWRPLCQVASKSLVMWKCPTHLGKHTPLSFL